MGSQIIPTQTEVRLAYDELIISKTDLSGRITYANKVFMRISDFSEEDLLGQPHNMIRHPDMPRGVFWGLWNTLKQGREFFGLVKNMTAHGDYYWVLANVRPDFLSGKSVGYFSVRRSPSRKLIEKIIPIYQQMLSMEHGRSSDSAQASWQWLEKKLASEDTNYERFILNLIESTKEMRV